MKRGDLIQVPPRVEMYLQAKDMTHNVFSKDTQLARCQFRKKKRVRYLVSIIQSPSYISTTSSGPTYGAPTTRKSSGRRASSSTAKPEQITECRRYISPRGYFVIDFVWISKNGKRKKSLLSTRSKKKKKKSGIHVGTFIPGREGIYIRVSEK